jgi:rSAM/selenodomain-associated transferase 2
MPASANQQELVNELFKADLSVVIPCRNEAESLPRLLSQLAGQTDIELEIIVADGGSNDQTLAIAQAAGAKTCQCEPNRGAQMNAGARLATAEWLLFLHADSQLSQPQQLQHALQLMQQQPANELCAGHFPLQFSDRPADEKRWRVLEYKTTLNLPLTISGDQGCLLSKQNFLALGGFQTTLPFLEDQMLAASIQQRGRWLSLPHALLTSARRFQRQGFRGRYLLMTLIMVAYQCGLTEFLDPKSLYPEQQQAGKIKLKPHLQRLLTLFTRLPNGRQLSFCWRIAGLARDNLYQLPLWLDAALGLQSWPFSTFWLKLIQPLTQLTILKTIWQLLFLPLFPLLVLVWLLPTAIGARIKSQPSRQ